MIDEEQLAHIVKKVVEANEISTDKVVRTVVNGKIDALTLKVDANHAFMEKHSAEDKAFQDKIEPYLQGAAGLKVVRDFAIWIAGGLVAWAAIKGLFK